MALHEDKLNELKEAWGIVDEIDLIEAMTESLVPGICINPMCDYTTDVEPDQMNGWCELCNLNTVMSINELHGLK